MKSLAVQGPSLLVKGDLQKALSRQIRNISHKK